MNLGTDPHQFIATARARACEHLARSFGKAPYTRDEMRLPVTLTFDYPARFSTGRNPTVTTAQLQRFRSAGLLGREVAFDIRGPQDVSVVFMRIDDPSKNVEVHRRPGTDDVNTTVNEVVAFLSTGATP